MNSSFVTDSQANFWINQSIAELWDILVASDPQRFYKSTTVSTTAGTKSYALPADFYQIHGMDLNSGDERITLEPYQFAERNRYRWNHIVGVGNDRTHVRYRVMGQGIDGTEGLLYFEPDPGTETYTLHYIQAPQELAADDDDFDGVAGWEEWVIYDVGIRMMLKEEADASALERERARIEARIRRMAGERDSGTAPRVQDTSTVGPYWRTNG